MLPLMPSVNWKRHFALLPVETLKLGKDGYFAPDGFAWMRNVWKRRSWYGANMYCKRHPLTGEPPTAGDKHG